MATDVHGSSKAGSWRRLVLGEFAIAIVPAAAFVLIVMWHNTSVFGRDVSGQASSVAMYQRLLSMDRFDAVESDALNEIRTVIAEAKRRGDMAPHFDHTQWGPVWRAYESVHGMSFAESSRVMARAVPEIIRENRTAFVENTARFAFWMLMMPDAYYRFQPGGAPGWTSETGESKRDQSADILDIGTYRPMLGPWLDPYAQYLPLRTDIRATTPLWTGVAQWFRKTIDRGPSILGVADSPYEAFMWFCLISVAATWWTPVRWTWALVTLLILVHILVSAVLAGPAARYAAPMKPLFHTFTAFFLITTGVHLGHVARRVVGAVRRAIFPGFSELRHPHAGQDSPVAGR